MPFDNPYMPPPHIKAVIDATQPAPEAPKPDRWNTHLHGTPGVPRLFWQLGLSDTTILLAMRDILRNSPDKWLRGNMGNCDQACAVGWLANFTEPNTRVALWSDQTRRLLNRLYYAMPKYAQKGHLSHNIGAYNDRSSNATLDRWLTRAIENEPR